MKCYSCGSGQGFELITDRLRYGDGRAIHRCASCSLVFLFPRMTEEEERRFYEAEYGVILSNEKGCSPRDLFQKQMPMAQTYLEWIGDRLRRSDDCLEIGCASGYFLHAIKERVHSVTGIETHNELRSFCGEIGIPAFAGLDGCGDRKFDKILLFFVLEHIGDPLGFLSALRSRLKPGGEIHVVVPNIGDALFSLYEIPAFRDFYFTPAHQFYYSPETLAKMSSKAGLSARIEKRQRYDLSNHMHWMMKGKPGGQGKYDAVFPPALLQAYAQSLLAAERHDTILAILS